MIYDNFYYFVPYFSCFSMSSGTSLGALVIGNYFFNMYVI